MLKYNPRNVILISFFAALVSAAVMTGLFFFKKNQYKNPHQEPAKISITNTLNQEDEKSEKKQSPGIALLLLGYGGYAHPGGTLADANLVIYVNLEKKVVSLISVPRDLWVPIPERSDQSTYHKVNMAFAIGNDDKNYPLKQPEYKGEHGGGNLAKKVIADVLGINIDYYAAIDFERFISGIDSLGGINVNVPVSFTDRFYPVPGKENLLCGFSPEKMREIHEQYSGFELEKQFECRYETLSFSKGETFMDGETALKFIRSRHSPEHGGDIARNQRTQAVLLGIKNKLLTLGGLNKADEFWNQFRKMVRSDIKRKDVPLLLKKVGSNEKDYQIKQIFIDDQFLESSRSQDGQSVLVPKHGSFQKIKDFVKQSI